MAIGIPYDSLSVGTAGRIDSNNTQRQGRTNEGGLFKNSGKKTRGRYDQLPQYTKRQKTAKEVQIEELEHRADVLRARLMESRGDKALAAELQMVQSQLHWLKNSY